MVDCRNIAELLFVVILQWAYSKKQNKTLWCPCRLAHMGPIAVIPFGLQEGFLLKTHGGLAHRNTSLAPLWISTCRPHSSLLLWGPHDGCIGLPAVDPHDCWVHHWADDAEKIKIWRTKGKPHDLKPEDVTVDRSSRNLEAHRAILSAQIHSNVAKCIGRCFTASMDNDPKHTVKNATQEFFKQGNGIYLKSQLTWSKPYRVCFIVIKATEGGCSKGTEYSICALSMGSRLHAVIDWKGFNSINY